VFDRYCGLLLTLASVLFATTALAADKSTVSGSFWENGESRAFFELQLLPGASQRVHIYGHRVIDVRKDDSGTLSVHLLDPDGTEMFATVLDKQQSRSFRLVSCDMTFELASPAGLRAPPACESGKRRAY
jgi:hypothetical protein